MGWLSDLLQGIPLNSVLRERVALAEQKFREVEEENKRLMEEVAALTKENGELKREIADAPIAVTPPKEKPENRNGLYYFAGEESTPYCPRCYETAGKKHVMSAVPHMGHQCTVCDKFIHN
ncbi:MAG TPA: hypothetical protein VMF69_16235 [Gemmataceae bacterium]|nr:hypothetical protein [Gemmataceae bacterium]